MLTAVLDQSSKENATHCAPPRDVRNKRRNREKVIRVELKKTLPLLIEFLAAMLEAGNKSDAGFFSVHATASIEGSW